MVFEKKTVKFADPALEDGYRQLAHSREMEDQRLFRILTRIRSSLAWRYSDGKKIERKNLLQQVFAAEAQEIWNLNLGPDGNVLYILTDDTVLILDVL